MKIQNLKHLITPLLKEYYSLLVSDAELENPGNVRQCLNFYLLYDFYCEGNDNNVYDL